ncbi:MAG TPA: sigma-70 family RNA polymerase sigma factor [Candidatus Eisenbacteria bacterium]|nr:sigma-70 family RNA polymerase sigma factor [Candidatus Eisenbacteria bacterium]
MTEREGLLARAVAGEESAWRDLVARYQALVHSVIRAHRIAASDGEDLFQETFLRLHRHAGRIEDPRALTRWLMVTARHLCLDHLARRRRESLTAEPPDLPDPGPELEAVLERMERAQEVREALATLSPRCRELLRALYYEREEPDYRQVAGQLGMPVGSVGPTRMRCLERLLEALDSRRRKGRSA